MAFVKGLLSDNSGRFILRRYGKLRVIALVSCALAFVFLSGIFAPFSYRSNTTEAASQSTQPSSLTLTSVRNTATVSINPTSTGVFGKSADSASISFNVITNNFSGYTLSTRTSRTTMTNGSSSLSSLASTVSESQFSNASNTTLNNRWGYKPNYYNSSTNSNFLPSPGSSSSTLDHTTVANSTAKNYTIVLGARVNTEVPAGTYVNDTLVLEATANAVPYTIKFNKAADDDIVSNMPANKTGESVSANNVTLPSTTPTRVNYTFAGWCTTIPVASAGGYTCNGTTYAAGSDYEINFTVDNTDNNLYAIWTSNRGCNKAATTIGTGVTATDAVCMQDINDTVITSMVQGTQHTLIDMRDGKSYFIAKQADGKVWMTQNLDYDLSTSTTLTHNNTDLGYTTSNLTKTWTPVRATITGAVSSWHNDASVVDSFDPGTKYYYSSGTLDDDTESSTCNDASTCAHYHVGNYYNWPAAVAGNIPASNDMYTKAEDSVCPAGWRLIKGPANSYTYGEEASLLSRNNGVSVFHYRSDLKVIYGQNLASLDMYRNAPVHFVRAGYIKNSDYIGLGKNASYWAEVEYDSDSSFDTWVSDTSFILRDSTVKGVGFPVRCIARMTTGTTTINFNANGGTGTMASRTAPSGNAINITNEFERDGYKFVKWNTEADGSGTDYAGVKSGSANGIWAQPTQNFTVTLYAQWEESFIIKYDGNNATGSTTMSATHEVADNEAVTLYASNYSRAGYGFLGWSTTQIDPDAANAEAQIANAKIFGPNETITANATTLGRPFPATVTLYAVWIKSAGNMQDWNGCSSMSIGDVTALKDTRDDNVYAIAKLADGNCWMIENFRLDAAHSSDPTKAQGFMGNFAGLANSELSSITNTSILPNSLYTTDISSTTLKLVYAGDFQESVQYSIPRYNSANTVNTASEMLLSNNNVYSYGVYYNWAAAKATTTIDGGASLCPSGWKLPSGYSDMGFSKLNTLINGGSTSSSLAFRKYPYNFIYSGMILNGSVTNRGYYGHYWSDFAFDKNAGAYSLELGSTSITPSGNKYKTVGQAIRCTTFSYDVAYLYANDGSNRKTTNEKTPNGGIPLDSVTFLRDNYAIVSWNTTADGSGTSYPINTTLQPSDYASITALYAQWAPAYKITYNGNGATNSDGMSTLVHPYTASNEEITLYANNYNRPGYGFLGWSTTQINPDASNAATLIANAKIFGPTETITANQTTLGVAAPANVTLYAVWLKSSGNINTWSGCSAMTATTYSNGTITPGSVVALTDTRDNNTYAIAKLSDGNCWMIEDLRINPTTANITKQNTNNPTSEYLEKKGTNMSYCSNNNAECIETNRFAYVDNTIYSGYYYNWYTATAGNGLYSMPMGTAQGDICPAGWQIAEEFTTLGQTLGFTTADSSFIHTNAEISDRLRTYPNNFVYTGYVTSGYLNLRTEGAYWTSKPNSYINANYLSIQDDGWNYGGNSHNTEKKSAIKVRCLKKVIWITYDSNNATGTTTTSVEHILKSGNTITLMPSNFSRPGYGFAGWSTTQIDPDSGTAATQIINATIYGPNQTVSASDFSGDAAKLYAVWVKSAGNLQNWSGCSSLSQGRVTALKDTRDNQVYAVAKLADGNCWMIENLRLDAASSTDSSKSQGFGGVFTGLASTEIVPFYDNTLANSQYTTDTTSLSLNIISGNHLNYRIPRYNNSNTNLAVETMTQKNQNIYSYGNYYNWSAANANTNDFGQDNNVDRGTSICPSGWRLPTGGSSSREFLTLQSSVNNLSNESAQVRSYPNNFILSGYANNSGFNSRGTLGYYWSRNSNQDNGAYRFTISESIVEENLTYKYLGASVRCVKATGVEIVLDSNDGTDRVARIYGTAGDTITIPEDAFIYEGYKITSWNTSDDGSGTSYATTYTIPSANARLYAQWSDAYTIRYNGNNATSETNMNNTAHLNIAEGDQITLYSNNYGRTGYGFLGWSTTQIDPDAANASTLIANAKIFGPNETITVNSTIMGQSAPAEITLYAVWLKSSGTIQEWNGCGDMVAATYSNGTITPGGIIALTDLRDGNTYAVAKLTDGKCWMIENLRINPATANITTENTNEPTTSFLGRRTQSFDSCSSNTTDCIERVLFVENNAKAQYSGSYYNWYTVTAGNGMTETTSVINIGDICPAGWHLPSGDTTSTREYTALSTSMGGLAANLDATTTPTGGTMSGRFRTYPNNFQYNTLIDGSRTLSSDYRDVGYTWAANGWTSSTQVYFAHYLGITETLTRLSYGYQKQYYLQARCIKDAAKVKYNGNGADNPSGMAVTHPATPSSTITLYASNYKRDGHGFLGWSLTQIDPDATDFATQLSNATVYGPNQTITLPSTLGDTTNIYAVWIKSTGDMQSWNGCSSMSTGDVTARKDTRDNQVYAIAKLADGNCWMIENLRLSNNYDNSDWGDINKSQGFGGVFNGLANSETITFTNSSVSNSIYTSDSTSSSPFIISGDNTQYRFPRYNDQNITNSVARMASGNENVYSYGNYYSFNAANANTNELATVSESENSGTSICPRGWRLPTAGSGKEYELLNTAINSGSTTDSTGLRSYPNNFIYSGYFWSSSTSGRGSYGRYYSSSSSDGDGGISLSLTSSEANPSYTPYRNLGASVRCIAATGIEITLSANDGSNKVAHIYGASGSSISLSTGVFSRNGYTLSSWNTSADGSGTSYTGTYTVSSATTLYAQWSPAYTIKYDSNNATSATTMNAFVHPSVSDGSNIMLYANNVERTGYGFAGWSTTQIDPDDENAALQLSNAKVFGPNQTITANQTTLGQSVPATITLYAVWVKSEGSLQGWDGCGKLTATTYSNNTLTPGSITALTDDRDGTTYAIAKLTDNQCWMIESLRINPKTANITSGNTNKPTETFLTNRTTTYSWCSTESQACAERVLFKNNPSATYAGNYYNWFTATAGNGTYTSDTGTGGDLCPAGWHLPTGGTATTSEYATLGYTMGGKRSNLTASTTPTAAVMEARHREFPNNFMLFGYTYYSSTNYNFRTVGQYAASDGWHNTTAYYQYFLGLNADYVRYSYGNRKYVATLTRCIKGGGSISYNGNGATNPTAMDNATQTEVTIGSDVTLLPSNYQHSGYGFLGWSLTQIDPDSATFATDLANATIYGPNETINTTGFNDTTTLYAVWIKSAGNLQGWTGCSSLSTGGVTALKDTRDNQVYAVAKLADGNCWMIENLRLDAANSTDSTKSQGFGGVFGGLANSETATFTDSVLANSLYTTDVTSASLSPITGTDQINRIPRYNNQNTANATSSMTSSTDNVYSYGNYYNWAAAVANTGYITTPTSSRKIGSSICPAGWRLPTASTSSSETGTLASYYGSDNTEMSAGIRRYPVNYIYSGYMQNSTRHYVGTYGYYWGQEAYSSSSAYGYYLYSSYLARYTTIVKNRGLAVRCIRDTRIEITLDSNDGSDRVARLYGDAGSTLSLPTTEGFFNENYILSSWNTSPDGTGTNLGSTYTIPSGATSSITLYAQWTDAYTIKYDGNNAESAYNMNSTVHSNISNNSSIKLNTANFHRTGYGFLGWSTTQINPDASNAATLIANAKIFGPNETITANSANLGQSAPATVTLYAVWLKASGIMQDWDGCTSMTAATYSNGTITPGSVVALTDYRDNETYAVAKLEDGSCWTIENLRTDLSIANITASNTNKPSSEFLSSMRETNTWCSENDEECIEKVLSYNLSSVDAGRLYNWYTATAGNGKTTSEMANGDICPAGWHLPTGADGEMSALTSSIGGTIPYPTYYYSTLGQTILSNLHKYPHNFIDSGYYADTSIQQSNYMYYFTSSGFKTEDTYYSNTMFTASSAVYLYYGQQKQYGASVRCVKHEVKIQYNGNNADNGITMSGYEKNTRRGAKVTLDAPNYKRDGYGFLGWSTTQIDPDASDFSTQLANATVYGPSESITVPSNSANTITYYAVWIKSAGNLQGWTGCSSLSTDGVTALKDTRDNQVYAVAKLADGNCWMIENLRLDAANSTDSTKSQGFGGSFNGLANPEVTTFVKSTLSNSKYTINRTETSLNLIVGDNLDIRIPRYNNQNTNNTVSQMSNIAENIYSYGNYYNYAAATASTMDVSTSSTININGTSICPTGWRLPLRSKNEYTNLGNAAKTSNDTLAEAFRKYPNNFVLSGLYDGGNSGGTKGEEGEYWAAYNTYGGNSTILTVGGSNAIPNYTTMDPAYGASVRCLVASDLELKLDANNGSGKVARFYVAAGNSATLPDGMFFEKDRVISSWNTAANGSGTSYTTSYSFDSSATTGVTLYAQWSSTYTILYEGNGNTGTQNMIVQNIGIENGDEITLYASNYSRSGYGFAGWSTTQIDPDASNAATQIAAAKIYGPNETITADSDLLNQAQSGTRDIVFYAVWVKSAGNMQDWQGCSSMSINEVTARRDTRDGNVYAIAKLADGQCWMIENLRLSNNASSPNWGDATASQGFGGVFNGLANSETALPSVTTYNSLYTTTTSSTTRYIITGNGLVAGDNLAYRFPRYNSDTTTAPATNMMSSNANVYSYGNYYTWPAAVGNTQFYRVGDGTHGSKNAGTSICPSGWQLPDAIDTVTNSDYNKLKNALVNTYGTTSPASAVFRKFPNNYVYNGQSSGTTLYRRGWHGYYWTSDVTSATTSDGNTTYGRLFAFSNTGGTSITQGYYSGVRCRVSTGITVRLEANDGSGRIARIYGTAGSAITLPTKNFARSGSDLEMYGFTTTSAGTGTVYTTSYTIPSNSTGVTLYAQWKQSYTINYEGNGDSGLYSMSVTHKHVIEGDSFILYPSNFKRDGYGFLGWSFTQIDPDASNFSTLLANATVYGPMETITAPARTSATMTLYAVWIKSAGSMQNWAGCSSMTAGNVTARTDTRDNNTYAIAKLADGNCWMIENLRLNHTASITTSNTQGFGGVFNGLAASESANFTTSTTSNSLYGIEGSGSTYIIDASSHTYGSNDNRAYSIPRYNNMNTTNTITNMTAADQNVYSYGNYYNHAAAIADTTMYTDTTASESSNASICPKGWKLPSGGSSTKEAETLATATKINSSDTIFAGLRRYPNNFIFSGEYYSSGIYSVRRRGLGGAYYTRSTLSTSYYRTAASLIVQYESTASQWTYKYYGASVRCLASS